MGFTMVEQLNTDGIQVVYQGTEGAYQHGAALRFFGETTPMYHVKTFEDVMVEVEEGRADYGVLPIENSSAGAVSDNYDNLVKHNLYIVAEIQLPVNHAPFRRPRRRAFRHKKGVLPLPGADAVFQIPGFPPGMGADEFGEYSGSGPKSDPGRGYIPGSCGKPYCRAALRAQDPGGGD